MVTAGHIFLLEIKTAPAALPHCLICPLCLPFGIDGVFYTARPGDPEHLSDLPSVGSSHTETWIAVLGALPLS